MNESNPKCLWPLLFSLSMDIRHDQKPSLWYGSPLKKSQLDLECVSFNFCVLKPSQKSKIFIKTPKDGFSWFFMLFEFQPFLNPCSPDLQDLEINNFISALVKPLLVLHQVLFKLHYPYHHHSFQ
ncbi:hypothetical protein OCU04_007215 [Sclerotinia nivalis]|uniref:Uncharacterized protein n=1 Tax=Sclerotinia nivalis TaxID=352851 RepID=A0A9X0ALD0_9HELO|nr:hypothetical protein OCU04_007215 [Sclerotinia nivalis]